VPKRIESSPNLATVTVFFGLLLTACSTTTPELGVSVIEEAVAYPTDALHLTTPSILTASLRATLTEEGSENLGETVNVIDACQPGYEGVLGSVSETELFDLSQDLVSEYEDGMWSLGDISDQIQGYLNDFTITGDTSLKSAICEALQDNSNIVDTFIALQPVSQGNADSLSGGPDSEVVPPD